MDILKGQRLLMMKRMILSRIFSLCLLAGSCFASDADDRNKDVKRLTSAGEIIREIMDNA